jgi:hypothetical protein
MWKERIYVPINQALREQAIRWCHNEPMAGHPGIAKTLELTTVTTRYGLLHYANLIRRTGPYCFLSIYLI